MNGFGNQYGRTTARTGLDKEMSYRSLTAVTEYSALIHRKRTLVDSHVMWTFRETSELKQSQML